MTLAYFGISLPNQLEHPLKDKIRFCSSQELSKIRVSHDEYCDFLNSLKELSVINECALTATCNRFEVILDIKDECVNDEFLRQLSKKISYETGSKNWSETQLGSRFSYLVDDEAKLQIYRTYCGLNSGLIGEDEICIQFDTAFRQAIAMGYLGNKGAKLLEEAKYLRTILNRDVYGEPVSYCDVAIRRCLLDFDLLSGLSSCDLSSASKLNKIVVFGSGNTAKKSCLSLISLGVKPENITVIHRISRSSIQMDSIMSCEQLEGVNTIRSKDGYRTEKVKNMVADADLLIFGVDTKEPILELDMNSKTKIIDFNSNPSCAFVEDKTYANYISNLIIDSYVREFSKSQIDDPQFLRRITVAEDLISRFIYRKSPLTALQPVY